MKNFAISIIFCILSITIPSFAKKLDLATHTSLIEKLESATRLNSKDSMVLHNNLAHRLADLYAERARLLAMDQEGKGAQIHEKQINSDRRKAIAIHSKVVKTLKKSERGSILIQIAHMHELLDENHKALKIYRQIERSPKSYDNKTNSLVQIKLGDYAFINSKLVSAQKHFENSLRYRENPRAGYAQLRLAWVNYNRGQTKLAEKRLISLLQTPALYSSNGKVDQAFQEEVSRDLATFMARNDINDKSIELLSSLSPENTRKKNLVYLATELDRTAKKKSALKVWAIVGQEGISLEDQLDRQINITRIEYDLNRKNQLLKEIDNSIALLKSSACRNNQECIVAQQNLRRIITDWAKAETRVTSASLIIGFKKFTDAFADYEMNYWAAQMAMKRKQYKDAFQFYVQAATILKSLPREKTEEVKMFEGSLLGAIEVAELSKDPTIRLQSYQRYLEYNPQGSKRDDVRYQIAHWHYERNDYTTASNEFRILALDKTMRMDLREKSADLCLDTDVLLKNEELIEKHSLELAEHLPRKKNEFLVIWRKSILNQTAKILNNKSHSNDAYEKELKKISSINIATFPHSQRRQMIKNKMELSFRMKDLDALSRSSNELLAAPKVSKAEKEKAFHHLAWIAEVRMNFKLALNFLRQTNPSKKQMPEYYLKVAMLKELSGQNPSSEFRKLMTLTRDRQKLQYAAHQLVLNSKHPEKEFNKHESLLRKNKALYISAGTFAVERSKGSKLEKKLLSKKFFRNSPEGQFLVRENSIQEFKDIRREISRKKLRAMSDAKLQRRMNERIKLLGKLEKIANRAIRNKDTTLQLIFLPQLAEENQKLAQEITALPLPRGLKAKERQEYQVQVQVMVQPYVGQSQAITLKSQELWTEAIKNGVYQQMADWSLQKTKPGCQLAAAELKHLRSSAQSVGLKNDPFEKLSNQRQKWASEARSLQERIAKDPFNFSDLEKMKSLQSSLGSGPMVAYLDNRLSELRTPGGRN